MIHFLISSLNSTASSIDKGLAIFSFIVIWFLSLNGIFIFIIFMFYFLPQSYENNLKAQCFCYKKRRKPCYLSQTAGLHRFLILYKDYNIAAFFTGRGFRVQRYEEKSGKSEKIGENRRKIREIRRKTEKNEELSVNLC